MRIFIFVLAALAGVSQAADDDPCRAGYGHLVSHGPASPFWVQEAPFLKKLEALGLRLRRAGDEDGRRVRDFVRRVRDHDGLGPLASEEDFAHIQRFYDQKRGELFMIEDAQGKVVATMGYAEIRPGVMELKRVYLDPLLQGQGLGSGATRFAIREMSRVPGVRRIELMTTAQQERAIGVYRLLGFTPFEPEPGAIPPGAKDRIYYGLDLSN